CNADRLQDLLAFVDSPRLKILLDPANLVHPLIVFKTTEFLNDIFDKIGSFVVAIHAKDVVLSGGGKIIAHMDEAVPGRGFLDYPTLIRRLNELPNNVTLYVEHFPYEEVVEGQQYIRYVARQLGITLY